MSLDRFEQALLKSGTDDRPTSARRDAARSAMLRAVGISAAVAATAMTTTSTAAGTTAGAGAAGVATVKTFGIAKLVLLALLSTGAVTTIIVATRPRSAEITPVALTVAASAAVVPQPVGPATAVATSLAVSELPSTAAPAPAPIDARSTSATTTAVTPTSKTTEATAPDPLAVEARILEAGRACLAGGDRACAHARLAEHQARFARGSLIDEASILAIDVAIADSDRAEARRIARALLARRPNGTWSSRVRKLAEETDPEKRR